MTHGNKPPIEITHPPLVGHTQNELESLCDALGEKRFRGRQLCTWLYCKRAAGIECMTDLPAGFRSVLQERYSLRSSRIESSSQSSDGTLKFLVRLSDGQSVEMVLIPGSRRLTVCVSTQVGCAVQCIFCASGKSGLVRNLAAGEIVEEVIHALDAARDFMDRDRIDNIVFMGIGEPLMNYENVVKAVRIINAPWGLGIGARRMTISTVGLPKMIDRLAEEQLQVNLAISLHALDDETRNRLTPINRRIGVENILAAAQRYFRRTGREITFEIVLIDGINATKRRALTLAERLKPLHCNVNVIPLNPTHTSGLYPPPPPVVDEFCATLRRHGINVHLRRRRGRDINAACGQLRLAADAGENGASPGA